MAKSKVWAIKKERVYIQMNQEKCKSKEGTRVVRIGRAFAEEKL